MKLALIRRNFSATGGAELYLQRLLGALAAAGHELHLFAEGWNDAPAAVTFHRVAVEGSRAVRPVRFAEAVKAELAKERFDCVFSLERTLDQDVYRAGDGVHRVWLERRREFAAAWKKPFVGWGAFHRNMRALETQTFDPRHTRHIIVNSEMVRREILRHFHFPAERIHLVRNGVDVARFRGGQRAETRARFGIKDDEFLLLFVGSGWERKGLKFVLAAIRRIAADASPAGRPGHGLECGPVKLKLLVVGKGSCSSAANVIHAGPMSAVENAYAAADLFVFPPIYEPSANVCVEALAAGLPVVTTAQNGASELIQPEINGTVLPDPADTPALAGAILYWHERRHQPRPPVDPSLLDLGRNVAETMRVLEFAAAGKGR